MTLYGPNPRLKTVATSVPTYNKYNPFDTANYIRSSSVGAGILYQANRLGRRVDGRAVFEGDGSTTDFTLPITGHDDAAGALDDADNLRVVAVVNGVVLTRVSSGGSPSAGEFIVKTTGTLIEFGTTYGVNTRMEVMVNAAGDVTSTTHVANVPQEIECKDFMLAKTAAVTVEALNA